MSQNINSMTVTWNNAGTTFAGIQMDVTDSASNAASLLMDLKVGGTSKFKVSKGGYITVGTGGSSGVNTISSTDIVTIYAPSGFLVNKSNGNYGVYYDNANLTLYNGCSLRFSGDNGAADIFATRIAAGILKISDNSTGPGVVVTQATVVASLPAAATAGAGARAFVTDANSVVFNAAAVGGGANKMPVFSNGAGWFIG